MVTFNIRKILATAKEDYEKAWMETSELIKRKGKVFTPMPKGKLHPVNDFICEMRPKMAELGFEEIILPMFVDEEEVYKEYGPEAALILDRLFYIAELPRPDIGISQKKLEIIRKIVPDFDDVEGLKSIFRRYKKGDIEADDLLETMIEELGLKESEASAIIDRAFPEFKELKPIPTRKTLRSHTTALWFPVLAELYKKKPLPLQYFLIGPKWRREQKIDATHLICSNTLSIVIMTEDITLEDAMDIGRRIASVMGFPDVRVEIKKATSKYYAPGTEFEIFVKHPTTGEWIEIGDGGFYSPVSLARFGIDKPVINIGFGVERIVMIKTGEEDIRKLVYPYYYTDIHFTDEEIAEHLGYAAVPRTEEGREIARRFKEIAEEHADDPAPVELTVWEGILNDKKVRVKIWEHDEGARLLGRAAFNEIWVDNGNILARSRNTEEKSGIKTGLGILEGIANFVGAKAEELTLESDTEKWTHRIRIPRHPSEINLKIDDKIRYFITSKHKRISIRGPVFIGVTIEISEVGKP